MLHNQRLTTLTVVWANNFWPISAFTIYNPLHWYLNCALCALQPFFPAVLQTHCKSQRASNKLVLDAGLSEFIMIYLCTWWSWWLFCTLFPCLYDFMLALICFFLHMCNYISVYNISIPIWDTHYLYTSVCIFTTSDSAAVCCVTKQPEVRVGLSSSEKVIVCWWVPLHVSGEPRGHLMGLGGYRCFPQFLERGRYIN